MTLRRGQIRGVVVLAVLALAAAGGLAGITTRLHSLADEMVGVTREIRGATDLEVHLRGYYRVPDRRRTYRRQFETALAEAHRHVRTEEGRKLLADVRVTAEALFATPEPASFEVSKIQAGGLTLELETADAREIVRRIVELSRSTTDRHALELDLPEREVRLPCDPARLEQVLENLVGNAIKYSPNGGAIQILLQESPDEVRIEVTDPGPGIAPEDRARIFEPFGRLPASRGIPGTGVGLSIAKAIVEAHRGSLEVESAPGGGSTFRVRLPRGPGCPPA